MGPAILRLRESLEKMMHRPALAAVGLALLGACVTTDACDEYVDYMCECHADDPDYDCNTLRIIYQDAIGSLDAQVGELESSPTHARLPECPLPAVHTPG